MNANGLMKNAKCPACRQPNTLVPVQKEHQLSLFFVPVWTFRDKHDPSKKGDGDASRQWFQCGDERCAWTGLLLPSSDDHQDDNADGEHKMKDQTDANGNARGCAQCGQRIDGQPGWTYCPHCGAPLH